MPRLILFLISTLFSFLTHAESSYQVDLILFAYPADYAQSSELLQDVPLLPVSKKAIPLQQDTYTAAKYFHLLKHSNSSLNDVYQTLDQRSSYQLLAHYSWRQPEDNRRFVALPSFNESGWQMQGTVRIRQSNYYLLDTELQFAPSNNPDATFILAQKKRLKEDTVYYFDHPQIGMLVKIHKIAETNSLFD